jgi:hypothetical protein
MKTLILLMLLLPSTLIASDELCDFKVTGESILGDTEKMVMGVSSAMKRDFKRRRAGPPLRLALSIETNFEAPLIGKDIYWGRIYVKDGVDTHVMYRDDLVAEDNYHKEQAKPDSFSHHSYPVKDINSAAGLTLIKAAGAEVNVKAVGKFSPKTGGRLSIKVKAPSEKPMNVVIDVVNNAGKISNFLIVNNKRVQFDSFKINASKNFLGVTTILSGIQNIQFTSGGKVIHTITP